MIMKLLTLTFSLFILFSSCSRTPISQIKEEKRVKKIQLNQSYAIQAQKDYQRLQAKRLEQ
jgi:hypothetical protein